ncbi:MAG: alpha/beta fold hydrolase [Hyphomicrobiales bacterium]
METFDSDGVEIAYADFGDPGGAPILLIHGFASNHTVNWVETGWVKTLTGDGRRVVAIDNRGHGASAKLYRPDEYSAPIMAEDANRLLDHLRIETADVMGYSMGARITAFLAFNHGGRVRSAIFGGLGERMVTGIGGSEDIAQALEAPTAAEVQGTGPKMFRKFAERTGGDLRALAACMRSARAKITADDLGRLSIPVLVAVGDKDTVGGPAGPLAALIPQGQALVLEGRDHMTAVGSRPFKAGVLAFLEARP